MTVVKKGKNGRKPKKNIKRDKEDFGIKDKQRENRQ